jgi:MFS superfamily sulfate permease-like transporter
MNTESPVEVFPPEGPSPRGKETVRSTRPNFSNRRLAVSLAVAAMSDGLSILLTPVPPLQWAVDGVTALLLFVVLGWQWILLPGLVMEAIPGLNVVPFWVLVVGAVAMWGTARPDLKSMVPSGKGSAC